MIVSIILVGKNEGFHLKRTLQSAYNLIDLYKEIDFEVIYVDSKSTDNSIEIAKSFPLTRIFEITGVTNSAIARNIGAKEAKGEILFFVDADMEIHPYFLRHALNEDGELKNEYITGHLDDYFYTKENEFISSEPRTYKNKIPKDIQELNHNGGLCLINKSAWADIGGMRNKYRRSQDLDLTIRLKKKGIKILRLPCLAAKHHTIDYRNEKRMWKTLWQGNSLYPGLLFRDHFFNITVLQRVVRSDYTALLLFCSLIALLIDMRLFLILITSYLFLLSMRAFYQTLKAKSKKSKALYFFERIPYQILTDLSFWFGFLCFFPGNHETEYKSIN
nr:glycosyltransferase [uncultured Brumimicrobium sp.]